MIEVSLLRGDIFTPARRGVTKAGTSFGGGTRAIMPLTLVLALGVRMATIWHHVALVVQLARSGIDDPLLHVVELSSIDSSHDWLGGRDLKEPCKEP